MQAGHPRCDQLESIEEGRKSNSRRRVLVPDCDCRLAFTTAEPPKLEAITDKADIALVGVKQIDRPIFGLSSIVSKRSSKLELQGPPIRDQQVWRPLRPYSSAVPS